MPVIFGECPACEVASHDKVPRSTLRTDFLLFHIGSSWELVSPCFLCLFKSRARRTMRSRYSHCRQCQNAMFYREPEFLLHREPKRRFLDKWNAGGTEYACANRR